LGQSRNSAPEDSGHEKNVTHDGLL
jgi:hypothetical protein